MPHLIVTENARLGLERCRQFLVGKNPQAARNASSVIRKHFSMLEQMPLLGKAMNENNELRELIISSGNSGYIALYQYVENRDMIVILAFRHLKELEY